MMQPTTVIGLGSSKIFPLNHILEQSLENIDIHFVDTTQNKSVQSGISFHWIGKRATNGQGCGGDLNLGNKSAEESKDTLWTLIPANGKVLFLASMAGGTGAGVLPTLLRLAEEKKALATSIVTMPLTVEGAQRAKWPKRILPHLLILQAR